jgi:hypothetical protein
VITQEPEVAGARDRTSGRGIRSWVVDITVARVELSQQLVNLTLVEPNPIEQALGLELAQEPSKRTVVPLGEFSRTVQGDP